MTDTADLAPPPAGWTVAGEALVDLAADPDGRLAPHAGGSPFNVAVGTGRLEVPTRYLGTLSRDGFGRLLHDRLSAAGVNLDLARTVDGPTTLAIVHLDDAGRASYGFYLEATSAAALRPDELPPLPDGHGLHLSFGAIGPGHAPTGGALRALVRRERGRRLVSFDPNVRPAAVGDDVDGYRAALDAVAADCDLVKASDEDLDALGGVDAVSQRWAGSGPAVVVVTRGPDGASAIVGGRRLDVPGRELTLVDTVGAGDAFTAGLLWSLHRAGVTDRAALDAHVADDDRLRATLHDATLVAAATCERPGADPPELRDLPDAATPEAPGRG